MRKHDHGFFAYLSISLGVILLALFSPAIAFGLAWFGGWILKICVGETIANGLNLIFNTTRFTPDIIPLACATLATIGGYFKSTQTNRSKN